MKRDLQRQSVLRYYISAEWLHRFYNFSEPGPITNHDFLCPHGLISARHAKSLQEHYVELTGTQWDLLEKKLGVFYWFEYKVTETVLYTTQLNIACCEEWYI